MGEGDGELVGAGGERQVVAPVHLALAVVLLERDHLGLAQRRHYVAQQRVRVLLVDLEQLEGPGPLVAAIIIFFIYFTKLTQKMELQRRPLISYNKAPTSFLLVEIPFFRLEEPPSPPKADSYWSRFTKPLFLLDEPSPPPHS